MKVDFYILQIEIEPGLSEYIPKKRNKYLFSQDFEIMHEHFQIPFKDKLFQVESLEWDQNKLKAICVEVRRYE